MAKKKSKARPTDPVTEAAARAAAEFTKLDARFALVGGLAVSAWAEPRYTRDVDLAVAVERDDEAEGLVHALSTRGYEVVTIIEQTKTNRLATAIGSKASAGLDGSFSPAPASPPSLRLVEVVIPSGCGVGLEHEPYSAFANLR